MADSVRSFEVAIKKCTNLDVWSLATDLTRFGAIEALLELNGLRNLGLCNFEMQQLSFARLGPSTVLILVSFPDNISDS